MDYLTPALALAVIPTTLPLALFYAGRRRSAAVAFLACLAWTGWLMLLSIDSPAGVVGGLALVGMVNLAGLIASWPARRARV